MNSKSKTRSAGVLMHITSLPSAFGIGDLGPDAVKFIDFLHRSRQRYWQVLPLNPVGHQQSYSPYSSSSSMAGNPLLISPELLAHEGLLTKRDLQKYAVEPKATVNFAAAQEIRNILLKKAYDNFQKINKPTRAFEIFCSREAVWLDDFVLYTALKTHYHDKPWFDWPSAYSVRKTAALKKFQGDATDTMHYNKWLQFVFFKQWHRLKKYANQQNVQLFGDLPFYVSYDSADVWSHATIFNVNRKGVMTSVAGVPPDYFNSNGQLWGMPTFRWRSLKKTDYKWWIQRIKKNMEMYDLLRLDHFRAFADYWDVPGKDKTAIHGKWRKGPGKDFFYSVSRALKHLPFVAEDLGDINEEVHELRNTFQLPGMKILQFAFGDTMPTSGYIPHNFTSNFIVYTGTHDNNTTRGWFRKNTSSVERKNVNAYTGKVITEKNIHEALIHMAYGSVANTAIIPMQDILGLDERSRMNTPASTKDNWLWRMSSGALTKQTEIKLKNLTDFYNR